MGNNPKDSSKMYHKWSSNPVSNCFHLPWNKENSELERIRNWRGNVMNCVNSETFANEKSSDIYILSGPSEETSLFPSTLKYRYFGIRMSWSVDFGGKFKFHHVALKDLYVALRKPSFKMLSNYFPILLWNSQISSKPSAYFAEYDIQKDNLSSYPS